MTAAHAGACRDAGTRAPACASRPPPVPGGTGGAASEPLAHAAQGWGVQGKHCRMTANTIAYIRPSCGRRTSVHEARGRHVLIFGESAHVLALRTPWLDGQGCSPFSSVASAQQAGRVRCSVLLLTLYGPHSP